MSPTDLGLYASQAALQAAKVSPEAVNSIVFGNVISSVSTRFQSISFSSLLRMDLHLPSFSLTVWSHFDVIHLLGLYAKCCMIK